MRCAAALASAFEEVAQVRYSRSGNFGAVAAAEPGFGPDRKLRQRLGDVIDRLEGVQRAGAGIADFIDSGGNRRLDVLATSGTGIALPFTPGRNHCAPSQRRKYRQFSSIDPANEQRLCWNLNALLQKIGDGNRGEITISWMVKPVTAISDSSTADCGEVLQFCACPTAPPLPTPPCPSRDRDIAGRRRRALAGSHGREEDRATP